MSIQSWSDISEFERQQQENADRMSSKQIKLALLVTIPAALACVGWIAYAAWLSVGGGL